MGKLIALPFVLMAAIRILIGIVIFAPLFIPLALLCLCLERET